MAEPVLLFPNTVTINLKALSKENYDDWSFRVKTYLLAEGFWKIVDQGISELRDDGAEEYHAWNESNANALHIIHISCGDDAFAVIRGISSAKIAWDTLAQEFSQRTDANVEPEKELDSEISDIPTANEVNVELQKELDGEKSNCRTPTDDYVELEKETELEGVVEGSRLLRTDDDITEDESINDKMFEDFLNDLDRGKFGNVLEYIKQHPEAVRVRHPSNGFTALHKAVWCKDLHVVEELVHLMKDEDLETLTNKGGYKTALHLAIKLNKNSDKMLKIVKCMVRKNKKLVTVKTLLCAFRTKNMILAQYLFSVSPPEIRDKAERLGFIEVFIYGDWSRAAEDDSESENELEIEAAVEVNDSSNTKTYADFFDDLSHDKFDVAMAFIKNHPEAIRARDPLRGRTALHYAVWSKKLDIVKELVRFMTKDDLLIKTDKSETALVSAIKRKNSGKMIRIAKCMIEKNKKLLTLVNSKNETPLIFALSWPWVRIEMAHYLFSVSPLEVRETAERMGFKITSLGFFDFEEKNFNWDDVMGFIRQFPEAIRAIHPLHNMTALHYAIEQLKHDIATTLVQLMTADDLAVQDDDNYTALHAIALTENPSDDLIELAKSMVEKNRNLLTIVNYDTETPLVAAFMKSNWKLAEYFYSVTPLESIKDTDASLIICQGLRDKQLDIPWDLIQRKPSLALTKSTSDICPLGELAGIPSAFLSGSRLSFWERWVYDRIYIKPTLTIDGKKELINEISTDVDKVENEHSVRVHMRFSRGIFVTNLLKLLGFHNIYQMKLFHIRILEFLHCMCKWIKETDYKRIQEDLLQEAIFRAVERGHVELITLISRVNSNILRNLTDSKKRTVLHFAAECRQEKVFSLIHGFSTLTKQVIVIAYDESGKDNIVEAVSNCPAIAQSNRIRGAALQMQRELMWFKEVENIARPAYLEAVIKEKLTPRELFTKTHRELAKEGEKSMKETANSCTVVGALVITMMFAATFTVPGGNNGDIGTPMFLKEKAFKVFMVSDAISLLSSTTSVMIFSGILTSRYAENDFLISLPRKMILGLLTLFLSISAMMIAFSSALFLMLPKQSWIAVPATVLSGIPIASFIWMQFPFLIEIFISTYGAGHFDRNIGCWKE